MYKAKSFSVRFLVLCFIIASLFLSCNRRSRASADALDADTSYAFGMLMASSLSGMGIMDLTFDYDAFTRGFKDFNEAQETRLTPDQAMELINIAVMNLYPQDDEGMWDEGMWIEGEINREAGEAFMAENMARGGVTTTASGLQYEVLTQGSGRRPGAQSVVRVHYEGTLIDGTVFDSSYRRGEPIEFNLSMVIPGWTEGLQLMNEGSTYRFVIPPYLAYGNAGTGGIPPNSTLIFDVELIAVVD